MLDQVVNRSRGGCRLRFSAMAASKSCAFLSPKPHSFSCSIVASCRSGFSCPAILKGQGPCKTRVSHLSTTQGTTVEAQDTRTWASCHSGPREQPLDNNDFRQRAFSSPRLVWGLAPSANYLLAWPIILKILNIERTIGHATSTIGRPRKIQ